MDLAGYDPKSHCHHTLQHSPHDSRCYSEPFCLSGVLLASAEGVLDENDSEKGKEHSYPIKYCDLFSQNQGCKEGDEHRIDLNDDHGFGHRKLGQSHHKAHIAQLSEYSSQNQCGSYLGRDN